MSKICSLCFDPMLETKNFNQIIDNRHNKEKTDFTHRYIVCPMCFLCVNDKDKRDQLMIENYLLKNIVSEYHENYCKKNTEWLKSYDEVVNKLNSDNLDLMTVTIEKNKIIYK